MSKPNIKLISELSTLSGLPERVAAMNWFALQSEEIKVEVLARQSSLTYQKSGAYSPTPEFWYGLLILAIKQIRMTQSAMAFKRNLTTAETEELSIKRIQGKPLAVIKGSKKLDRFRKDFFPLVELLRSEHQYSFTNVISFLRTHHGYDISKSYLQNAYKICKEELSDGD